MKDCECCGVEIEEGEETTECPECQRMRCPSCDMGSGTICGDCENGEFD